MPKYEKVDDHTIRIIVEKADEVPISRLLENKKSLEEQRNKINKVLKNIDEMLKEAKRLGITPLEEIPISKQDRTKPPLKPGESVK